LFGEFDDLDTGASGPVDLRWPGYEDTLARAREKSGENEAVVCAVTRSAGREVIVVSFDFRFVGGSLGAETGRLIEFAAREALTRRTTLVSLTASGGARMQEGLNSLTQMQRIASVCSEMRDAGVPHLCVANHPTTGGVWASLAALADVILAVPGATVAFSGDRVRGGDGGDPEAFTAEGKLAAGAIDAVVPVSELPATVARYLALLRPPDFKPVLPPVPKHPEGLVKAPKVGWDAVCAARKPSRPHAVTYLDRYFSDRISWPPDRLCGADRCR
jgi:acetyl-CoA carboxylase carboxyl transferase subunit beta